LKKSFPGFNLKYRNRWIFYLAISLLINTLSAKDHFDFNYGDRSSFLSAGWDFNGLTAAGISRNTEMTTGAIVSYDQQIHPGVLRIPVDAGDLWEGINNTRNTLFHALPSEWTSIRIKIVSFDPTQNNQQATLVAYQDDDNYVQISRTFEVSNRIMFTSETDGKAVNLNSVEESSTKDIYLRLDRIPETQIISSYYSPDGIVWTNIGNVVHTLNNPKLAIETGASPGGFPNADIAWAEVSTQPLPPNNAELRAYPSSIVFNTIQGRLPYYSRSIFIFAATGEIIGWKQTADVPWLTGDLKSGVTDGILKMSINATGLLPGVYYGNISIESPSSTSATVIIPVSLIVNPDSRVEITTWKDGKDGAFSISVDDGQPSGYNELVGNGFHGTYVTNGTVPPSYYTDYYNAGMELGSHLVNHPCNAVSDDVLRSIEIQPNILNLCIYTPLPINKVISLVWPCGFTNYREEAVASEYFLSARGYNINKLEDPEPENLMNLKSYNSHEHTPLPPSDLKTLVDSAVLKNKWFNLVLHNLTNDDGAINYSRSKNIWVAPIGTVIKYILQRERFIFGEYSESSAGIKFNVSRLPVPSSAIKNFEEAFNPDDLLTLQIDIDDNRLVESVLVNGLKNSFHTESKSGNRVLFCDIKPEPDIYKDVEINYRSQPVTPVNLSSTILNFNTLANKNPDDQYIYINSDASDPVRWNTTVTSGGAVWKLRISPDEGLMNDTIVFSVNSRGLPVGTYTKTVTLTSPDDNFYPFDININLKVNPFILHQNYPNPFNSHTWIEYDLPEDGPVTMEIFNTMGQKCETIISKYMTSGSYKTLWNSGNFSTGIYFLSIKTKTFKETIKMSLLK
jgi:hypothetical protein